MSKLRYEPIPRMSKRDISKYIAGDNVVEISRAILSAALYSGDGPWAEKLVYRLIDHEQPNVRGSAFISLGYIARIHGSIDRQRAIDVLRVAKNDRDAFVRGHANDALEDVQHYIKRTGRWIGGD